MARLRAAAASELTPPKAEARAPRCGGVELPSRTTRPRTTRTRELHLANNGAISACVRSSRAKHGTARVHVAEWAVVNPIGVQVASPRPNTRGGARR